MINVIKYLFNILLYYINNKCNKLIFFLFFIFTIIEIITLDSSNFQCIQSTKYGNFIF